MNTTYSAKFIDGKGKDVEGYKAISPLFTKKKNGEVVFLGTCFFISGDGLMLTAKHCILDNKGKPYDNLFITQFFENDVFAIRPIWRSYWNDTDIAALLPNHMVHKKTKQHAKNPVFTLTNVLPRIGEKIASFGYPKTKIFQNDQSVKVDVGKDWHFGEIEEYHKNGISFLKNSCFQSSMAISAGSSGGPVANSNGKIFAINSIGCEISQGLKAYSFLTPIAHCLGLIIDTDKKEKFTIQQLINLNQLLFEGGLVEL